MNWLGLILSLFGTWLAGRKTIGWLVASLGNLPWLIHAILIKDLPLGISSTMFGIIGLNNYAIGKGYGLKKVFNRYGGNIRQGRDDWNDFEAEDDSKSLPCSRWDCCGSYGPLYDDGEFGNARFYVGHWHRSFCG